MAARRSAIRRPAARHADDRVLPRADRDDGESHPGTRDPRRRPGRRPPRARARLRRRDARAGGADRAGRPGPRGGRGQGARGARARVSSRGCSEPRSTPTPAPSSRRCEAADPERDGLAAANAWPLGARDAWDHYRSDGAVHATYWIGGWPRVDVSPMFMDALLGRASAVRTVAVTFEPIAPERSTRESRGGDHARPGRPRAAPPLRAVRDRPPAPGTGRDDAPRGGARRRPRRGSAGRFRDRLRTRPRRAASARAPRSSSTRPGRGWSCTACTGSRRMRSRSRCRCAGG